MARAPEPEILLLRLEAPLLAFGGQAIDEKRVIQELPARSTLTGLLANALGWLHTDVEALQSLQQRLDFAVRRDRPGDLLEDYQTVDLGQPFLRQGWTTRGRPEGREGGSSQGTHISRRHYLAGAAFTVALRLDPAEASPTLDDLHRALRHPARPLFLGRKACQPSRPLVGHRDEVDRLRAPSVLAALAETPAWASSPPQSTAPDGTSVQVWWPAGPTATGAPPEVNVPGVRADRRIGQVDDRDWSHQLFGGTRYWHEGTLELTSETTGEDPGAREGGATHV